MVRRQTLGGRRVKPAVAVVVLGAALLVSAAPAATVPSAPTASTASTAAARAPRGPADAPVDIGAMAVQIGMGDGHTCVLTAAATVRCWGWAGPELGGTVPPGVGYFSTPLTVAGVSASSIDVGNTDTCAVTTSGGASCWGEVLVGGGPSAVPGLTAGVKAVAVGARHACGITSTQAAVCWGDNAFGQLGDGTTVDRSTPVGVVGLSSGVTRIEAGNDHTCALLTSGAMRCWGRNEDGQVGDGTTVGRFTPVAPTGLGSGVAQIDAAGAGSCAVLTTGALRCWGYNASGRVGDGTTTDRTTPTGVSGLSTGTPQVRSVDGGGTHTCATLNDGALRCWGRNQNGQIGDGTTVDRLTPVAVPRLGGDVEGAALGRASCAIVRGGVRCWGYRVINAAGDGHSDEASAPVSFPAFPGRVHSLGIGGATSCAIVNGGRLLCWGDNDHGEIGDGTFTSRLVPTATSGLASGVVQVVGGEYHTCAIQLDPTSTARCWGRNDVGAVGDTTSTNRSTPVAVSGLPGEVADMSAGLSHTCAYASGSAYCWGGSSDGQVDGTTTTRRSATAIFSLGSPEGAGGYHTCAEADFAAFCWGRNSSGQLGDGTTTPRSSPVGAFSDHVTDMDSGNLHSCAIGAGALRCWGSNGSGRLGDGTTVTRLSPVAVSGLGSGVTDISAGGAHTCAIAGVSLRCWGLNASGQVGDGTTSSRLAPVSVLGSVFGVGTGANHTCAVIRQDSVRCWGDNSSGQVGDGTLTQRRTPTWVSGLEPWAPHASWRAAIGSVFAAMLGRAPTSAESTFWLQRLDSGIDDLGDLVAALRTSTDHLAAVDPLARLYWAYFLRRADFAGFDYWLDQLRSGARTLSAVSDAFAGSSEFTSRYGSLSNRQFVQQVYLNVLGRAGDSSGVDYWTGRLDTGARTRGQVMLGFSDSSEFTRTSAPTVSAMVVLPLLMQRSATAAEFNASLFALQRGTSVAAVAANVIMSDSYAALVG